MTTERFIYKQNVSNMAQASQNFIDYHSTFYIPAGNQCGCGQAQFYQQPDVRNEVIIIHEEKNSGNSKAQQIKSFGDAVGSALTGLGNLFKAIFSRKSNKASNEQTENGNNNNNAAANNTGNNTANTVNNNKANGADSANSSGNVNSGGSVNGTNTANGAGGLNGANGTNAATGVNGSDNKSDGIDLDALRKKALNSNQDFLKNGGTDKQNTAIKNYNTWAEAIVKVGKDVAGEDRIKDAINRLEYIVGKDKNGVAHNGNPAVQDEVNHSKELLRKLKSM